MNSLFKQIARGTLTALLVNSSVALIAAHAGDKEGNGGSGIACTQADGSVSVRVLDYFEAEATTNLHLDLGSPELDTFSKVELVLKRIEKVDPSRATRYFDNLKIFNTSTSYLERYKIKDIPDTHELIQGKGNCYKTQIAVQRAPRQFENSYFWIDNNLWKQMSSDDQAGLILHEIIFKDELSQGATNSDGVRMYNAILSSLEGEKMDAGTYTKDAVSQNLQTVSTGIFRFRNVSVSASYPIITWPNGNLRKAHVSSFYSEAYNQEIKVRGIAGFWVFVARLMIFNEDGSPASVDSEGDDYMHVFEFTKPLTMEIQNQIIAIELDNTRPPNGKVIFRKSGRIDCYYRSHESFKTTLKDGTLFTVKKNKTKFVINDDNSISDKLLIPRPTAIIRIP